jgi:hypothetical protein
MPFRPQTWLYSGERADWVNETRDFDPWNLP